MIIHVCKYHGPLTADNFIKKGKNKSGTQAYRCKLCMEALHAKHYIENKEKIDEKNRLYRKKNKQKIREMRNDYYEAAKELFIRRKRIKANEINKQQVIDLSDRYVKDLLTKHGKFKPNQITPSLIEEKRNILIEKRQRKEQKDE